jgi:hypothetical protein
MFYLNNQPDVDARRMTPCHILPDASMTALNRVQQVTGAAQ